MPWYVLLLLFYSRGFTLRVKTQRVGGGGRVFKSIIMPFYNFLMFFGALIKKIQVPQSRSRKCVFHPLKCKKHPFLGFSYLIQNNNVKCINEIFFFIQFSIVYIIFFKALSLSGAHQVYAWNFNKDQYSWGFRGC